MRTHACTTFMTTFLVFVLAISMFCNDAALALDNGVARTPPMGWNTWNTFKCDINETLIREAATAIATNGMKDAGYVYVNIDDCWQRSTRDADGNIVADPKKFPSGMKALADFIHSLGLKLGIYTDAGLKTCQHYPGSYEYEVQDALQYSRWGIDYVKVDWCYTIGMDPRVRYPIMRDALLATNASIVFSMCEWGVLEPWTWAKNVSNLWRTTPDIEDTYASWTGILETNKQLYPYAAPGGWNDPDMLVVGIGGQSTTEYIAHFSLWSIMAAPLIAGNDIRKMDKTTAEILLNKEVIAVNQDPLGIQGRIVSEIGVNYIFAKPLVNGCVASVFFNKGESSVMLAINFRDVGFAPSTQVTVRDLWLHKTLGNYTSHFGDFVKAHSVLMLTLCPVSK